MRTKSKVMAIIVSMLLTMALVVPTYADNTYTNATSGQVEVNLEVASSYSVALPASITLAKATDPNDASNDKYYDNSAANPANEVAVTGNIADNETVTVTPDASIELTMARTAAGNETTTVAVTQEVKEWKNSGQLGISHTIGETEPLLLSTTLSSGQAGMYTGNLHFTFAKTATP